MTDEEELRHGWVDSVRTRLPWLALNLVTASLAGIVTSQQGGYQIVSTSPRYLLGTLVVQSVVLELGPLITFFVVNARAQAWGIDTLGPFNMLLCDSHELYCYCSTNLSWLTRRAPFGPASLIDTDMTVDFAKETTPKDIVTVIATHPLTDHEPWIRMAPGGQVIFRDGLPVAG